MSDVQNDVTPEMERALREKICVVYAVIDDLQTRFALPLETKLASREIIQGLSQLWAVLQEFDAEGLGRYGTIDSFIVPLLDPQIKILARLMFALEHIALGHTHSSAQSASDKRPVR